MHTHTRLSRTRRSGRLRLALGIVIAMIPAVVLPGSATAASSICSSQTGTNSGYYYQMWTNGTGSACMTLNSGNSYSTSWSGVGDFVDGGAGIRAPATL